MILKNLNTYNITKKKKYKLKRFIVGIISPIIIITSLTGCKFNFRNKKSNINSRNNDYSSHCYYDSNKNNNSENSYSENNYNSTTSSETDSYEINTSKSSLELDDFSNTIIGSSVTLYDNDISNIINDIRSIRVSYPYSDLYGIRDNLIKYNNRTIYKPGNVNIFTNNSITADIICSIVKENNDKEISSDKQKMPDSELRKICSIMADLINDYIKNNDVDLNLLSEKILDLKIAKFDDFSNGYYDNTTSTLGFNLNSINKSTDFYKKTVEHEIFHILAYCSRRELDNSNYSNRSGISYRFEDSKVNSMSFEWFDEGAAEYLTLDRNNTRETEIYQSLIKNFDMVKVSTILSNNSLTGFEELSFSNDLNDLFSYFKAETDYDKEEILNMMYAYNLLIDLNSTSSSKDFYNIYKEKYGSSIDSLQFSKDLKSSIGQTLTKQFYINLINKCQNNTVSIKEIFSLISIFENELSREIWYSSSANKDAYMDFYLNYNSIQSSFFELLGNKLGVSLNDVQQAYNSYNAKADINPFELTLISNDKKDYLSYILETRKNDKMNSVNYVSENLGIDKSR